MQLKCHVCVCAMMLMHFCGSHSQRRRPCGNILGRSMLWVGEDFQFVHQHFQLVRQPLPQGNLLEQAERVGTYLKLVSPVSTYYFVLPFLSDHLPTPSPTISLKKSPNSKRCSKEMLPDLLIFSSALLKFDSQLMTSGLAMWIASFPVIQV